MSRVVAELSNRQKFRQVIPRSVILELLQKVGITKKPLFDSKPLPAGQLIRGEDLKVRTKIRVEI